VDSTSPTHPQFPSTSCKYKKKKKKKKKASQSIETLAIRQHQIPQKNEIIFISLPKPDKQLHQSTNVV